MKTITIILLSIIMMHPFFSNSTIIHIPTDYPSIQQGIDASVSGDTIIIHPGEYLEHLILEEKNLTIGSQFLLTGDTSYIYQTIINGNDTGRGITIGHSDSLTRITGLTFTNCRAHSGGAILINESQVNLDNIRITGNLTICDPAGYSNGGGISINNSTVTIEEFVIQSNEAYCITPPINPQGGGIYAVNSSVQLTNGQILDNQAYLGGGILLSNCNCVIHSVEIKQNYAPYPGGAICSFNSSLEIRKSTFSENTAPGSVIYLEGDGPVMITNSLFINNSGYVIHAGHILKVINCTFSGNSQAMCIICDNSNLSIMNSIFWNEAVIEIDFSGPSNNVYLGYNVIQGGMAGIAGNGSGNFFGPIYDFTPGFANDSTYRLSDTSLCIGAGLDTLSSYPFLAAPDSDIDNEPRPNPGGSMPDLGAYENELANPVTGIQELATAIPEIEIYPNPSRNLVCISSPEGRTIESILVIDARGRLILEESFHPHPVQSYRIKLSDLGIKGLALIEIILESAKISKKVVVW